MKKNLLLYLLLVFLVIMNGFFLFQQFKGRPGPPGHKGPKGPDTFLIKRLDFTEEQKALFTNLSEDHHREVRSKRDAIRRQKDVLFSLVSQSGELHSADSVAGLIGQLEGQVDLLTFDYFSKIRALCAEDQKKRFDRVMADALHKGGRKRR